MAMDSIPEAPSSPESQGDDHLLFAASGDAMPKGSDSCCAAGCMDSLGENVTFTDRISEVKACIDSTPSDKKHQARLDFIRAWFLD